MNWAKWESRDPAEVFERKENQTCKGCAFTIRPFFLGDYRIGCEKGKKHSDNGGSRCKHYQETEGKKA